MTQLVYTLGLITLLLTGLPFWLVSARRHAIISSFWSQEFWPGSTYLKNTRQILGKYLFTFAIVFFFLRQIMIFSHLPHIRLIDIAGCELAILMLLAKVLYCTPASMRQLLHAFLCVFPFAAAKDYLLVILFILAARDIDIFPVFKTCFAVTGILFLCISLLSQFSFIGNGDIFRHVSGSAPHVRYSLGFIHPNTAGYFLTTITASWLVIRSRHIRWWDWALGLSAVWFISEVIDSRGSMLSLLCTIVVLLLFRIFPSFFYSRFISFLIPFTPLVFALTSFLAASFYNPTHPVWAKINAFSSDRLYLFNLAVQSYSITPFGQLLDNAEIYTLDNTYLTILFQLGIFAVALFVLGLCFLLRRLVKMGATVEISVVLGGCVFCLFEALGATPTANLSLWLLTSLAWGTPPSQQSLFTIPSPKHLS